METCIECYSTNISALEIDFNCDGCSLVECEDCYAQFTRDEMAGVEHEEGCTKT